MLNNQLMKKVLKGKCQSLEQSIPMVLDPEKPCCNNSSPDSSSNSSINTISTEPEEICETKDCASTMVDSNLQLNSHTLKVKKQPSMHYY